MLKRFRRIVFLTSSSFLAALASAFAQQPVIYSRSVYNAASYMPAGLVWRASRRLSLYEILHRFDIMLYCVPAAWMVGRLGCALAHDLRGLFTTTWIAVQFLEGSRYDLGLIELLFLIAMVFVSWLLDRKPRPVGFFFGLYGVAYGAFRMWLDTQHAQPLRFYEGASDVCDRPAGLDGDMGVRALARGTGCGQARNSVNHSITRIAAPRSDPRGWPGAPENTQRLMRP